MLKRFIFFILLILSFYPGLIIGQVYANQEPEELLIILDYSASMNKPLSDKTRARYVLLSLYSALSGLPDDTKIGLRVFGPDNNYQQSISNQVYTNHDCKATYLRVPIAKNNKHKITAHLSEYSNPFGQTPIELSLRQAIQHDFSSSPSKKHIVLITDGTDTCGGNPCKYISSVISQRKDIVIDVISIADKDGNYGDLSCLPKLTKGRYQIVQSANELLTSFNVSFKANKLKFEDKLNNNITKSPSDEIKYSNYLFKINY